MIPSIVEQKPKDIQSSFRLLKSNPTNFYTQCAKVITFDNKDINERCSVAQTIEALITMKNESSLFYWNLTNIAVRQSIKSILMENLFSYQKRMMNSTTQIIAKIIAIEKERKDSIEMFNQLIRNTSHLDINIRKSSINILGYVCKQIKSQKCIIPFQSCQNLLQCLLLGVRDQIQGEITMTSLTALKNAISFLGRRITKENFCDQIFQTVIFYLNKAQYCHIAYEILQEIAKTFYIQIEKFIDKIYNFIVQNSHHKLENKQLAFSFWDILGKEFLRRNAISSDSKMKKDIKNYIKDFSQKLLPQLMQQIYSINDNFFPQLRKGAVNTLTTLINCCGQAMALKILRQVKESINSNDWEKNHASALLLSSLCEYSNASLIQESFFSLTPKLFQFIHHPQDIVKRNVLNGLVIIAQNYPTAFYKEDLPNIYFQLVNISKNSLDSGIKYFSLKILLLITQKLQQIDICMQIDFDEILQILTGILIDNALKKEEMNQDINDTVVFLITEIINLIVNTSIMEFMKRILARYNEIKKVEGIILNSLVNIIYVCIDQMQCNMINRQTINLLFALINQQMMFYNCSIEAINMISVMNKNFKRYISENLLDQYVAYIMRGIDMPHQQEVFKASLNFFSKSVTKQCRYTNRLNIILQKLINYLENGTNKFAKNLILSCLGHVSKGMIPGNRVRGFQETIIKINKRWFLAVKMLKLDFNEKNYVQDLLFSIVNMNFGFFSALSEQTFIDYQIVQNLPHILNFVIQNCSPKLKHSLSEYQKLCVNFLLSSTILYQKIKYEPKSLKKLNRSVFKKIGSLIKDIRKYCQYAQFQQELEQLEQNITEMFQNT